MERTPFNKNVSLKAYLNKDKNLNITQNNISLVEHILKQNFNNSLIYYSVTRLVAHPECTIEQNKIQTLLYKNYSHFQFGAIKTNEQKTAFINRFDLTNNILIAPNTGEKPNEIHYSIGWLQFFLLGTSSFQLFDWAKQYNSQYSEGLKSIDYIGLNIWHTLVNAVSNMPDNLTTFNQIEKKTHDLFSDYPEGMKEKNHFNETPYEMLHNISQKTQYGSHYNIKKTLALLHYLKLQGEVSVNLSEILPKKLKI
jgi:hypothetical protein